MTWGAIKRTPGDAAFSEYIREKSSWCCERCFGYFGNNRQSLHASHFYTRGNKKVRFDTDNVFSMCVKCHDFLGKNPHEHAEWVRRKLGETAFELLVVRAHSRRSEKLDHGFEAIRWRAALKELKKKANAGIMGAKA